MKNIFGGYYLPSDEEFKELWEKCIFVLDTNVLTNLYRYPKDARDDLINLFKKISERLWIPHQVALEYQENRLSVISDQARMFYEVKNLLNKSLENLKNDLKALSLEKRHSVIKPDDFLKKVSKQFEKYLDELKTFEKKQPNVIDPDKLRDEIDKLFEGKIGPPPQKQEDLDKIYSEGEKRYEINMPPGYMDIEKEKANKPHLFNQMEFKREYGDLILWYQLIDQAKNHENFKYIIFITDDNKEDWWWVVDSQGKKTIGPRPELVEEIKSKADVNIFYMYNTGRFLKYAQYHLKAEVKPDSISEVRDIHEEKIAGEEIIKKAQMDLDHLDHEIAGTEKQEMDLLDIKKEYKTILADLKSTFEAIKNIMPRSKEDEMQLSKLQRDAESKILDVSLRITAIEKNIKSLQLKRSNLIKRFEKLPADLNSLLR